MSRRKQKKKIPRLHFYKFALLFIVFLLILFIFPKQQIVDVKPNVQKESISVAPSITNAPTPIPIQPFDWSVEKVNDTLTKVSIPPDPRMSTADELFEAMSNYRSNHNLNKLSKNDSLCIIAQKRAEEQVANGGLDSHAGFSKYFNDQTEFRRVGEVLFGGSQPQYGVHIVEFGWDRSLTGHKEAIQNPVWNHGCAGVAGYYAVFIFGSK